MNLTYTLDSQPAGTFVHAGSPNSPNTTFSPSVVVFHRSGMVNSPHSLTVTVGPDSVFLLDYIVYTQESEYALARNKTDGTAPSVTSMSLPTDAGKTSPSPSNTQCVNSAYTSGSVVLLANHSYLPFARTPVLALVSFCVRCSLDLNLIRSFIYHSHSPVACLLPHPTLCESHWDAILSARLTT